MISEEIQELMGMCDRILIMKDGRINGEIFEKPGSQRRRFYSKDGLRRLTPCQIIHL